MDFHAAGLDAARQRVATGAAAYAVRRWPAWPQQHLADRRRCSLPPRPTPPPPPPPQGRRGGCGGGAARDAEKTGGGTRCSAAGKAADGSRATSRGGGAARSGVVALALAGPDADDAAGGNAAAAGVAGVSAGDRAAGVVAVVAREEGSGGGEVGTKRSFAPAAALRAYPPPKRRLVSATRRFPPRCGRGAAAPLAGADDDGSRLVAARPYGDSSALPKPTAPAPLSVGEAGSGVLEKVSAAALSRLIADGCRHGQDAGALTLRSPEPSRQSGVPAADGLLDTNSQQGVKESGGFGSGKDLVPATRLLPKPTMISAIRRFPPGCGRVRVSLIADQGSSEVPLQGAVATDDSTSSSAAGQHSMETGAAQNQEHMEGEGASVPAFSLRLRVKGPSCVVVEDAKVKNKSGVSSCNALAESLAADPSKEHLVGKIVSETPSFSDVAPGVSGQGAMRGNMAMSAPQKVVKPAKLIQKSSLDNEKEPGLGRCVATNGIQDTNELTEYLAAQSHKSADKCPWTESKESATARGSIGPKKKVIVKGPAHLRMKVASACTMGGINKLDDMVASILEDDGFLKALTAYERKLELNLTNSSDVPSVRCQRQYGTLNADARSKVKMMCRRFQFICRFIVQVVEHAH